MEDDARVIEISSDSFAINPDAIPRGADHLEFEIESETKRSCAGNCGGTGDWRFVTKNFICQSCRNLPQHKLITRSTAKLKYGLTFDDLHSAVSSGKVRMITTRNPHGAGKPPMRLYYQSEIVKLANDLADF
jgi:hypothetical protein